MNKLRECDENPIDNFILKSTAKVLPYLKHLKVVPNHITSISVLFGVLSFISLYYGYVWLAIPLLIFQYVFDCMDGQYARKYNMVTVFGDAYDHVSDLVFFIGITLLVFTKTTKSKTDMVLPSLLLGISLLFCLVHFGCQESLYETDKPSKTLQFVRPWCQNPEKKIKYTRFFGTGTFYTAFVVWIVYMLN